MKETIQHASLVVIPEKDHGVSFKEPKIFVQTIDHFISTV
jgi:hypothetical protein